METLQEYELPFKLSMGIHNNYWPYSSLDEDFRKKTFEKWIKE